MRSASTASHDCEIIGGKNTGDDYDDGVSGTDGHIMAYEYSPSTDLVVNAVQIFTGERERDSRVAVWTHASGPNEPGSEMAGEDFLALTDTGWPGARLSEEITLSAGWLYWVSWHAHYGQTSRASMGEYVAYKWSVIGSGTWNGPFGANEKFRLLYCTD